MGRNVVTLGEQLVYDPMENTDAMGPLRQLLFSLESLDGSSMNSFDKSETIADKTCAGGRPSVRDEKLMDAVIRYAGQGKSIAEISKVKSMPSCKTIYRWLKCSEYRARFDDTQEMHHLKKSEGRPYQMRIMIDRGPKKVGLRKTIPLETHDLEEAKLKRDSNIALLKSLGIKLVGHFPNQLKTK